MLIQIFFALVLGILFGTFTGLVPGIHINLIGTLLVSISSGILLSLNPAYLVVFISSMAITHTFLDFIPSILLGCPDTDTELSVLPGHELLKKGRGYEAIILTAYGSLAAIFLLAMICLPSVLIISKLYPLVKNLIPFFLVFISITLILLEKNKLHASLVFALTGFLGLCVLNLDSLIKEPLLPMLTGLFGGSMLVTSIKNKVEIPVQQIPKKIKASLLRPLLGAIIASPLCSFLPGLGSGQAAIIGSLVSKSISKRKTQLQKIKNSKKQFLVLLGATNTLVMGFSFISLYSIARTRTGAAVAMQKILGSHFSWKILFLIIVASLAAGIISFVLTIKIAKKLSKNLFKINYSVLSSITLCVLVSLVFAVSGFAGLLVLALSILTGLYAMSFKIKRTNMMGCLIVPVICFYFF